MSAPGVAPSDGGVRSISPPKSKSDNVSSFAWPPLPSLDLDELGCVGTVLPAMFTMDQDAIIVRRGDFQKVKQYPDFDTALLAYRMTQEDFDDYRQAHDDECASLSEKTSGCNRYVLHKDELVTALPAFSPLERILLRMRDRYEEWCKKCEAASVPVQEPTTPQNVEEDEVAAEPDGSRAAQEKKRLICVEESNARTAATTAVPLYERPLVASDAKILDDQEALEFDAVRYAAFDRDEAVGRLLADAGALESLMSEVGPYVARAKKRFRNAVDAISEHYGKHRDKFVHQDMNFCSDMDLWWNGYPFPLAMTPPALEVHQKLQKSLPRIRFEIRSVTGDVVAKCSSTRPFSKILHCYIGDKEERDEESGGVATRTSLKETLKKAAWYGMKSRAIEFALQQHPKLRENFGDVDLADTGLVYDEDGSCAAAAPLTFLDDEEAKPEDLYNVYGVYSGLLDNPTQMDSWKMKRAKAGRFACISLAFPFVFRKRYRFTYTLRATGYPEGQVLKSGHQASPAFNGTQIGADVGYSFAFRVHPITGKIFTATLFDADGRDRETLASGLLQANDPLSHVDQKAMAYKTLLELQGLFFECAGDDSESLEVADSADNPRIGLIAHCELLDEDPDGIVDVAGPDGIVYGASCPPGSESTHSRRVCLRRRCTNLKGNVACVMECKHVDLCLTFDSVADAEQFSREFKLMKRIIADNNFFETMAKNFRESEPWFEGLYHNMFSEKTRNDLHRKPEQTHSWEEAIDFLTGELHEDGEEFSHDLQLRRFGSATWLDLLRSVMRHRLANDEVPTKQLRDLITFTLVFVQRAEDAVS